MIIPAIDLIGGKVVRLYQGDYSRKTEYDADPQERFDLYVSEGAKFLHLVDLDGAKDTSKRQLDVISELIKNTPVPVEIGGGIRTEKDVEDLLNIGTERVVVGSAAVKDPKMAKDWFRRFGAEHIVLALDINIDPATGKRFIAIKGWQENSAVTIEDLINDFAEVNLKYVLCTDISRDGTLKGSNVDLYRDLHNIFPHIDFLASGGIGSLDDVAAVRDSGAAGIIIGRSLLEGKFTVKEAVKCWPNA
ncbi:MAG: 1-(5-phosphoribosyl)-5-[Ruminobacter sp.]|jgi:phosphoribosylformimino-5-aminoimidazole carboxamide ribotide isomerase|uniref:1-(5-phosphoribosyl)-5-[(5-phosphoribosylamino)methylideneamino] imidazole-4-carboxamide isomerase n=1 Tax=Ruminobacter amylophilus TaxID=867 RepID=A0A662ZGR3_9GAMM|nr:MULTISPECIES: 1-(5-phosphoribosyl)-5-[(5-phosphoribosylamino)methylideneamino]imidazole-4-carboxamide isomerase [Ruminobacter]MBQ3775035.1 1-(5-phosphoribosyl)-5-[(5-phosphoribosylamino)methylideneamino]imidazole-4-carboxamide isomerase [Ruminobacter sp.]SFP25900.1 1-(5-phosphoribosyl)-5-[(5-phosphoribosylamino)methylideneamino] imidazole-4-carboxamide isomerase [Ruminobacter amylophilus]